MSNSRRFAAQAVVIFVIGAHRPYAPSAAQDPLATATSLSCVFSVLAVGTWTKGEPEAEVKTAKLSMRFHSIDAQDGTAEVETAFGPSHIIVRLSEQSLHFLQIGSSGPVYLTSVFGAESRGGKLKAVHTRHEYTAVSLPGFTSRPEQYYGNCEPGK